MPHSSEPSSQRQAPLARVLNTGLFAIFMVGLWLVISPFLEPLLWALIIVTALWPAYRRLVVLLNGRESLAALLMTTIIGLGVAVAIVPISWKLSGEVSEVTSRIREIDPTPAIEFAKRIPLVGQRAASALEVVIADKAAFAHFVSEHEPELLAAFTSAAKGVLSTVFTLVVAILSCYFLFRRGTDLARQLVTVLKKIGGDQVEHLIETVNLTVRGAAYSVIVTAVAQGTLAGIGFFFAGAPVPILLGMTTMILSLIPFGAPLLYSPIAAYLFFFGPEWYYGVGLALWGVFVVSTSDNILRPLFICQATRSSIVLVFVGVIGGVVAFGMLGVFVGPAIVAVAQRLWIDYSAPTPTPGF